MEVPGLLRRRVDELLHLVELVDPEEPFRIEPVRPDLAAETRAQPRKPERQILLLEDLVAVHRGHRVLARRDEVLVLTVDPVHDVLEVGEVGHALVCGPVHHVGRNDRGIPVFDEDIHREPLERHIEQGEPALQEVEPGSGNLRRAFEVRPTVLDGERAVVLQVERRDLRFAPSPDLDVLGVVLADGHALVEDVREPHQAVAYRFGERLAFRLHLLDPFREACGFGEEFGDIVPRLPRLADLAGNDVSPVAEIPDRNGEFPCPPVHLQHLVDPGQFLGVSSLREVCPDDLGVCTNELQLKHTVSYVLRHDGIWSCCPSSMMNADGSRAESPDPVPPLPHTKPTLIIPGEPTH
ncbi:hypothetical protein DSECCO2_653640 [anaerobic digester metagenome]